MRISRKLVIFAICMITTPQAFADGTASTPLGAAVTAATNGLSAFFDPAGYNSINLNIAATPLVNVGDGPRFGGQIEGSAIPVHGADFLGRFTLGNIVDEHGNNTIIGNLSAYSKLSLPSSRKPGFSWQLETGGQVIDATPQTIQNVWVVPDLGVRLDYKNGYTIALLDLFNNETDRVHNTSGKIQELRILTHQNLSDIWSVDAVLEAGVTYGLDVSPSFKNITANNNQATIQLTAPGYEQSGAGAYFSAAGTLRLKLGEHAYTQAEARYEDLSYVAKEIGLNGYDGITHHFNSNGFTGGLAFGGSFKAF